jgi:hypothetical protein
MTNFDLASAEFEAVGGVKIVTGFAVGVVAVGFAAAFGAEGDGG